MPDALIHHLTSPSDRARSGVVCGDVHAHFASWDLDRVTCLACQQRGLLLDPCPARVRATAFGEKVFLAQVRSLARARGWLTYHPLTSKGSEAGFPDLVLLRPPVLLFAEMKVAGGRITPAQAQWLDALAQVTTVTTFLWRPDDRATIVEVIR